MQTVTRILESVHCNGSLPTWTSSPAAPPQNWPSLAWRYNRAGERTCATLRRNQLAGAVGKEAPRVHSTPRSQRPHHHDKVQKMTGRTYYKFLDITIVRRAAWSCHGVDGSLCPSPGQPRQARALTTTSSLGHPKAYGPTLLLRGSVLFHNTAQVFSRGMVRPSSPPSVLRERGTEPADGEGAGDVQTGAKVTYCYLA
ncbi:hypothetical protein FQN60_000170 [Etheostoma spectabile]|uniref:Uncharacterized protein n=1 Tax=Etheostoma spectabile TaxID=54343 RepID=A0A5J5CYY8_9PERO|nr:hypothetical protein FQN60_000170 [Etheostoma spectabile]